MHISSCIHKTCAYMQIYIYILYLYTYTFFRKFPIGSIVGRLAVALPVIVRGTVAFNVAETERSNSQRRHGYNRRETKGVIGGVIGMMTLNVRDKV